MIHSSDETRLRITAVLFFLAGLTLFSACVLRQDVNRGALLLAELSVGSAAHAGSQDRLQQAIAALDKAKAGGAAETYRLAGLAYSFNSADVLAGQNLEAAATRGNVLARFALGQRHLQRGEWLPAVSDLDRAGCRKYSCVNGMVDRLVDGGQDQAAVTLIQTYLATNDDSATAHYQLSNILWGLGDRPGTIDALARALERDPATETETYTYKLAWLHFLEQDYDQATVILEDLLRTNAGYFPGWYLLGRAYLSQGKVAQASTALQKAVELDPEHGWARYSLAVALQREGKLQQATEQFQLASQKMPQQVSFLEALAQTYQKMGATCMEQEIRQLLEQDKRGLGPDLSKAFAAAARRCG